MTRAAPLLLLAAGCNAFVGHTGKADVGQHDQDSGSCGACDDSPLAASEGMADARCNSPREPVQDPFQLGVKAELYVPGAGSDEYSVSTQPIAVDVDGDGDREIVLFGEAGEDLLLSAFDHGGDVLWTKPAIWWNISLAGADVDGRDGAEIIASACDVVDAEFWCEDWRQAAISADGTELWSIEEDDWGYQTAGIADLRGDGSPVLIHEDHVFDLATGRRTAVLDLPEAAEFASIATADADGDGVMEFAMQGRLFDASGAIVWEAGGSYDDVCWSVPLQADDDDLPEFLFMRSGWKLMDSDGTELLNVHLGTLEATMDPPVVADFDGDGAPEIAQEVATEENFYGVSVFELDGTVLWESPEGYYTAIGGWDFDGDGAVELIAMVTDDDESKWMRIRDGRTGDVLAELEVAANSSWSPFAADLDGDGHAELLIPGGVPRDEGPQPAATILHQVNDTWPAAGPAWPTRDFQVSNIGPAGELPRGETNPPSWSYSVFHARPAVDADGVDLAPSLPDVCIDTCAGTATIQVQVTNTGAVLSTAAAVHLRAGDTVLAEATTPALEPGATSEGFVFTLDAASFDLGELTVVVDPDGAIEECDEADNTVVIADPR